jgi:hypothetical protein
MATHPAVLLLDTAVLNGNKAPGIAAVIGEVFDATTARELPQPIFARFASRGSRQTFKLGVFT